MSPSPSPRSAGAARPAAGAGAGAGAGIVEVCAFRGSHYCERALWAVQAAGLPLAVRWLAPGAHLPVVRALAPGRASGTVPVARLGTEVLADSEAIVTRALGPSPAPAIERLLCETLGPAVRRLAYALNLPRGRAVPRMLFGGFDGRRRVAAYAA